MNKKTLQGIFLLLITATVWGVAFVAQSVGMDHLNAFAFNCIRNAIGVVVLLPVLFVIRQRNRKTNSASSNDTSVGAAAISNGQNRLFTKDLVLGGLVCGVALCIASNFQQMGIEHSTVGKSAFITTLYIVLVPIL